METSTFVKLVKLMRQHQKAFFAAVAGSPERNEHYNQSKTYEKKVDRAIPEMESRQPGLFPEEEHESGDVH